MERNIYSYLEPGLVSFKAFPKTMRGKGPIVESIREIALDDFFTAVDIGRIDDLKDQDEIRKILRVSHLEVAYGTQPTVFPMKLNLNSFDASERKYAIHKIKDCIEEAKFLGARWLRIPAGKDPGPEKRENAKRLLVKSLKKICAYAKERADITVTLKIFDRKVDKESLIGYFDDAKDVADEVANDHDNFGLLVDLSHFPLLEGESPRKSIPKIQEHLVALHIGNAVVQDKDSPVYGDLQPRFGIEGGENDVDELIEFFRVLLEIDFLNPQRDPKPLMCAEVRPVLAEEGSQLVIANTKRVIKKAWARV